MADFQGYILVFFLWLLSFILFRTIFTKNRTTTRLPPSPIALPIIGHLHLLAPIPHQALHKLSTKHGPLIHIRLGSVPCVVASSPEIAKQFLKTHESSFSNRPITAVVDYLTYGSADFSFAPYGPYWKFMKKICMSELLSGRMLDQFLPVRREELIRFLQFMLKTANASEKVDVGGELVRLTNNIVSRMIMNDTCCNNEDEAAEVRKLVEVIAKLSGQFNLSDFIWFCKNLDLQGMNKKLKQVRDKFDSMMDRIIKEHEEARKTNKDDNTVKDLLDVLLDISQDESSEMRLTRENIKAFILDLFVAGTDTSAVTIEWALSELINHPNIMEKARQEIDIVVGKDKIVQESDVTNLPYLQAIVKETLRLHPAGPMIVRESSEDCNIEGYEIPAKTRLFINVWAIGRDRDHWENPLEFRPERFVNGRSSQMDVRGQHFHLLPFGSGRRSCPGTSMALQVVQTSLAIMIQCFDWKVDGSVDMEEGPGLTLPRAHPLICAPILRLNPFPSC
ncbi:hypothetical protein Goklo_027215 [Gossypium klotzschianum]|uniref:Uncharacterized protein n=1 Tax=Gossypium klotzschianum TaxID=34286 RepID=A0A7J8TXG6_9ROSI|nr:hypothetical protein [Gossypium klotzschianum]